MRSTALALFASALFVAAPLSFERYSITVEMDSPQVYSVQTTWWGLKETRREIRWMRAPGEEYEAWCARDADGQWYPYLIETEDP